MKYPLLVIHQSYILGQINNKIDLSYSSEFKMKNRNAEEYQIIDSLGNLYEVAELKRYPLHSIPIRQYLTLCLREIGAPLFNRFSKDTAIWVEYELNEPTPISLENAKDLVLNKIRELNPRWKPGGPSEQEIEKILNPSTSFEELINKVSTYP